LLVSIVALILASVGGRLLPGLHHWRLMLR
jgi:hypothetical protein